VPQQLQGGFRKPVFVGASPTRGSSLRLRLRPGESFNCWCEVHFRFFPPFGSKTILLYAPGRMTNSCAWAALCRGSVLPITGRSVPFSSPAIMAA